MFKLSCIVMFWCLRGGGEEEGVDKSTSIITVVIIHRP